MIAIEESDTKDVGGVVAIQKLNSINTHKGHGTQFMHWLCALADKHNMQIELCARNDDPNAPMNTDQLKEWYEKFGFVVVPDNILLNGYIMERKPH